MDGGEPQMMDASLSAQIQAQGGDQTVDQMQQAKQQQQQQQEAKASIMSSILSIEASQRREFVALFFAPRTGARVSARACLRNWRADCACSSMLQWARFGW